MAGAAHIPDNGDVTIGGIRLPSGKQIVPRLIRPEVEAVMWATDAMIGSPGSVWESLAAPAAELGLVPVILDDLRDRTEEGRPWNSGELYGRSESVLDDFDAAEVFRERWRGNVPISSLPPDERDAEHDDDWEEDPEETAMFLEQVAPWGAMFPLLALAEHSEADPAAYRAALEQTPPGRIGLVPAERGADIPSRIGWAGATNHFIFEGNGPLMLSVMMRSWEDRFGAQLFRLSFDEMVFLVRRPPSTESAALAVAAEHFAFAGQDGFQAYPEGVNSIRELASLITGGVVWRVWWD